MPTWMHKFWIKNGWSDFAALHQVVHAKFNLKIYYPLQYYREVWHYKYANIELIRQAIDGFNWQKAFSYKNVKEKVDTFNKTILNVLSNFIPHETIICDDRDPPSIIFIIFWVFLMFYQIFFLPQVTRCAIITYKHVHTSSFTSCRTTADGGALVPTQEKTYEIRISGN